MEELKDISCMDFKEILEDPDTKEMISNNI